MDSLSLLAEIFGPNGYIAYWQIPMILILIGLIIFWVMYRRRQM